MAVSKINYYQDKVCLTMNRCYLINVVQACKAIKSPTILVVKWVAVYNDVPLAKHP